MHAYFFSLTIILETEIVNHPILITDGIINALETEENQ
jgi:hypothetical protein